MQYVLRNTTAPCVGISALPTGVRVSAADLKTKTKNDIYSV